MIDTLFNIVITGIVNLAPITWVVLSEIFPKPKGKTPEEVEELLTGKKT
ncbi:MAG: hypothetical protein R6T78_05240 [Dehalococcoidales bacterium]